jgi:signal transduction histidine kinase
MRGTLRQLEVLVVAQVDRCSAGACAPPPARAADLRRTLRETWSAYRQLPTSPGEVDLWPAVEESLGRLDDGLSLTFEALRAGDAASAARWLAEPLRPAFDRLDDTVAAVAQFDRLAGQRVAARIDDLARVSVVTAVVLDAVAVALTALAAVLAIRFVRAHERALRERADDLDQFAGRVAHDIMSPLATTSAALWAARRHPERDLRGALETAEAAVHRVERLVDGLLAFARAGATEARGASAEVREVLEDVAAELRVAAASARVSLQVEPGGAARVACSPGVLTSILSNLARNAIHHMGASELREVRLRTERVGTGGTVRIEVSDTGPGVPPSLGERVFEPFVRGPDAGVPGAGLGLATARRFVVAHGGRIGFHPAPRGGTVFWFEMPAAAERVAG